MPVSLRVLLPASDTVQPSGDHVTGVDEDFRDTKYIAIMRCRYAPWMVSENPAQGSICRNLTLT